ncbi:MAG: type III secretion system cytoplasmic ring protein SctQ [Parachlamydiaceae bacterium]
MSELTITPYDWLRTVSPELKELDETPLWGGSPPFPWDHFSSLFTQALQLQSCEILSKDINWRTAEEIGEIINDHPFSLTYALNPLRGHAFLLLAHVEVEKLLNVLLRNQESLIHLEEDFIHGFFHFLGLEIADVFQKTGYEKNLTPQLLSQDHLPSTSSLCVDIEARINGHEIHGMLCISNELRSSIKEHYLQKAPEQPKTLLNKLEITLQLIAGGTTIAQSEWRDCSAGDVLILDTCSLEPGTNKGRIMLTFNEIPLFRGRVKEGNIKILEYPLYHEVNTPMGPRDDYDDEESDFDEDSDFDSDLDTNSDFDSESGSDFDDESSEYPSEEESDNHEDEEEEFVEDDEEEEQLNAPTKSEINKKKEQDTEQPPATKVKTNLIKTEDIPFTISIEIGRLQMTLQKLMELQPGNLLELDVHPENGVDLVVNGKCIAKGELLRLGEVLGVRILEKI